MWFSIIGPTSRTGALAASGTKKTTCGLPIETAPGVCSTGSSIGPTCSSILRVSISSASGIWVQSRPGAPMSTVMAPPSARVADKRPAAVSIEA